MKKEWTKPVVKWVMLEDTDIVTDSLNHISNKSADIDDGSYEDTTTGNRIGDFGR